MISYRIELTSWTAGFRYPNMISGFQPSLRVPPISTIMGLLSAACGWPVSPEDVGFGYAFSYRAAAVDLETLYQFENSSKGKPTLWAKSNIVRREFLVDTTLWLYVDDADLAHAFDQPYFPLLLGRSGDLAQAVRVEKIELQEVQQLDLGGTLVPFAGHRLAAPLQALPTHFSPGLPRTNFGTRPFYLLDWKQRGSYRLQKPGWRDPKLNIDLFWYERGSLR